jgi:hypothetical protein
VVENTSLHDLTLIKSNSVSKNCFQLQLGHSYFPILFGILKQIYYLSIYKIICSLFHINQRHDFFWAQQKIQCRDSDLDQLLVA